MIKTIRDWWWVGAGVLLGYWVATLPVVVP